MPVKINPIPYTQDELKEMFEYRDGELFWRKQVRSDMFKGAKAGTLDHSGYIHLGIHKKYYNMHRVIWKYIHGKDPKEYIDHINGIKNDNRIENLREASKRENATNTIKTRNGKLPGCCYSNDGKRIKKWIAYVNNNGKRKYLGRFKTEQEAHYAYLNGIITYCKDSLIVENPIQHSVSMLAQNLSAE